MACLRCSVPSLLQAFDCHTLIDQDGLLIYALVQTAGLKEMGTLFLSGLTPYGYYL